MDTILTYLLTGVSLVGAFVFAYWRGKASGVASTKAEQTANDLKAVKTAKGVENEIRNSSRSDVDSRFAKWVRDKE